jgi:hypothetical protein
MNTIIKLTPLVPTLRLEKNPLHPELLVVHRHQVVADVVLHLEIPEHSRVKMKVNNEQCSRRSTRVQPNSALLGTNGRFRELNHPSAMRSNEVTAR